MAQFPRLDNAAGVWKLSDVYDQIYNGTWPNNGAVGLFAGGQTTPGTQLLDTVDVMNITSGGQATVFGDLSVPTRVANALGSLTRSILGGGLAPSQTTKIEYATFNTTGNFADFGDLTVARHALASGSNSTKGIFAGGNPSGGAENIIDYITIASFGNAADFGDLTVARYQLAGTSNATRATFAGGSPASAPYVTDVIDYVTISTTGNATDFGNLLSSSYHIMQGGSNSTRGIFAGGHTWSPSVYFNTIQYLTFATTGNTTDFGDLTAVNSDQGCASNSVKAAFNGGWNGSNPIGYIEYVDIATTGNATDYGDLTGQKYYSVGSSNAHGGLTDGYQGTRPPVYLDGGNRGIFATSITPAPGTRDHIEYINIATTGNASNFGNTISGGITYTGAAGNETRSLFGPGEYNSPVGYSSLLNYVIPSTTGNAASFGNLTVNRSQAAGASNSTRAVFGGGFAETPGSTWYNTMDYVDISSLGNGSDFGDLSAAKTVPAATGSTTRGVWSGGLTPSLLNVIEYITYSTTGNATDFGDLTTATGGQAGLSSSTRACFGGGLNPANTNVIEYVTIASIGNATDFGDLTTARQTLGATSNSTRGVFAGGSATNVMDYITIASTGNATDFGDLIIPSTGGAGTSDGHGGLNGATLTPTPDRGLFMGGSGYTNGIDYITVSSAGNAADFGDLVLAIGIGTGGASSTRAIQAGGSVGGSPLGGARNDIAAITIATLGNASDFGDLTVPRFFGSNGNTGNNIRAVFNGGEAGAPANAVYNVIDYITIASVGNAIDFGDATVTVRSRAGMTSPTRAVFAGGRGPTGNTNVIDYITIAATGNATDFGDLLGTNRYAGGLSSSTRGVVAGGISEPGASTNVLQYITIGSTGNSIDFGDLTTVSNSNTALSNNTRGVVAISSTAPALSNVLEYITIATTGNSLDFGDLTVAKSNSMGACANHGGLQ